MFAKHIICGILLICFVSHAAYAYGHGLFLNHLQVWEEQLKREREQKQKEELENRFKETSKMISESLSDIKFSELFD